jgi:hypothetical protein
MYVSSVLPMVSRHGRLRRLGLGIPSRDIKVTRNRWSSIIPVFSPHQPPREQSLSTPVVVKHVQIG